jgi:hypothetical protein
VTSGHQDAIAPDRRANEHGDAERDEPDEPEDDYEPCAEDHDDDRAPALVGLRRKRSRR